MVSRLASYLLFVVFVLFATSILKGETPNLDARRAQLNQLLKDEWEYELKESPERATVIGDTATTTAGVTIRSPMCSR
jgi:hypothetical protein